MRQSHITQLVIGVLLCLTVSILLSMWVQGIWNPLNTRVLANAGVTMLIAGLIWWGANRIQHPHIGGDDHTSTNPQ
ncbi:hypothetical protein BAAM0499_03720 [Bifidobacterium animalis subsp. animalis MCC 0499]|nr:hypothetical protein BAAM0499_03720 [Bifidobacterium animalis subsp. animalis MCC 0499]